MEELLSWQAAARILGVSSPTLYKIVERKELTPARVQVLGSQKRRYFRRDEVEVLRDRRREGEYPEA